MAQHLLVKGTLGNFLSGMETSFGMSPVTASAALETSLVEWKRVACTGARRGLAPWKLP